MDGDTNGGVVRAGAVAVAFGLGLGPLRCAEGASEQGQYLGYFASRSKYLFRPMIRLSTALLYSGQGCYQGG